MITGRRDIFSSYRVIRIIHDNTSWCIPTSCLFFIIINQYSLLCTSLVHEYTCSLQSKILQVICSLLQQFALGVYRLRLNSIVHFQVYIFTVALCIDYSWIGSLGPVNKTNIFIRMYITFLVLL